jgi:hypothetical protein
MYARAACRKRESVRECVRCVSVSVREVSTEVCVCARVACRKSTGHSLGGFGFRVSGLVQGVRFSNHRLTWL